MIKNNGRYKPSTHRHNVIHKLFGINHMKKKQIFSNVNKQMHRL